MRATIFPGTTPGSQMWLYSLCYFFDISVIMDHSLVLSFSLELHWRALLYTAITCALANFCGPIESWHFGWSCPNMVAVTSWLCPWVVYKWPHLAWIPVCNTGIFLCFCLPTGCVGIARWRSKSLLSLSSAYGLIRIPWLSQKCDHGLFCALHVLVLNIPTSISLVLLMLLSRLKTSHFISSCYMWVISLFIPVTK